MGPIRRLVKLTPILLICYLSNVVYSDHNATDHSVDEIIYISLMVSSAPTLNTVKVERSVAKVVENVNRDSTILPGFSLQHKALKTKCDRERAVELFNMELVDNPNTVAVIGCGCSSVTEAVASASNGTIPVVSFDSTSVTLSDRSSFPNVFRTVPSDESLAPALTTLMQYYGWRKVAIVTEREQQFLDLLPLLNNSLLDSDISIVHQTSDTSSEAAVTEKTDSRIFFLNTNPRQALFHLCQAAKAERHYPDYIWITPGWYQQGWWSDDEEYLRSLNCSPEGIQQQLNRSLALLAHPNIGAMRDMDTVDLNSYAMDALMSLAIALNETLVRSPHLNLSLQDAIESTMFNGASGVVKFDAQGNRQNSTVLLHQYRMNSGGSLSVTVAARIENGSFTFIYGENNETLWPDSGTTGIPPTVTFINHLETGVYVYVFCLVAVGVSLSLVCLIFNIVFRNRKVVKLTSPNLNYVIVFGTILLMSGNIFTHPPSTNLELQAVFCLVLRVFVSIGYDICFVVALVKTIRVAYIFCNVSPVKKKVQDWKLLLLALAIIMIEVIFTIPLFALMYVKGDLKMPLDKKHPPYTNEEGYTIVSRIIVCDTLSVPVLIYFSLAIAFKLIIHGIGLILAFVTRKVKIDPLNDSRFSAILIYISAAFVIIAVVLIFAVEEINTYTGLWATVIFLEICVFLGFNFIPKMVYLYRDPKGENVFTTWQSGSASKNKSQLAAAAGTTNSMNNETKLN